MTRSLDKLYVASSFPISRICEDICVSCECSGKTASAGEGVTGREQQGGSGEGGLSSGHQSPEPPCPYLLDSLMKWPGWEG